MSAATVLPFPAPQQDRSLEQLAETFMTATAYQLAVGGMFRAYSRAELLQRGTPERIVDKSFPLYSFSGEPTYFVASVIAAALQEYPELRKQAGDTLAGIPHSEFTVTQLGGVGLNKNTVDERLAYLTEAGILPEGNVPLQLVNAVLWDVLYATYGLPVEYEKKVVGMPKKETRETKEKKRREIRDGEEEAFATEYMPLVKRLAYRIAQRLPRSVEVDDLISEGYLGLLDAKKKFDAKQGGFRPYAEMRIRGTILDYLRHLDGVSRSVRERLKDVEDARAALLFETGTTDIPLEQILERAGITQEQYDEAQVSAPRVMSLDDKPKDKNGKYIDVPRVVPDEKSVYLDTMAALRQEESMLWGALDSITFSTAEGVPCRPETQQNMRIFLRLYYKEDLNLKEIGRILGFTESRASQLHSAALVNLRRCLNPDDFE
ncbi:MAG: sigma-70 family RNA polymerase sigma factor [Candidatus Woesearchaeota archaeon]|nr:sigma-70 family RNA polymerase sigma factor [Candidatus Woesearchaeota archaeon]